jgi:hypothetical protein
MKETVSLMVVLKKSKQARCAFPTPDRLRGLKFHFNPTPHQSPHEIIGNWDSFP